MKLDNLVNKSISENLNIYTIASIDNTGAHQQSVNPADACTNSYSCAKAFTVTAIGMLWDEKKLDVNDKVYDILKDDFKKGFDPNWKLVTVEHLMKHTAGFGRGLLDIDVDNIADYGTDDFLRVVLSEPLPYAPGTHFQYTDAAFYLLSRIVTKISGKRLDDFLRPVLFGDLGFQEMAWSRCPKGYPMGATGLYLRTSDLVKLAWVYVNNGTYYGKRIVSEEWVNLVITRGYEFKRFKNTDFYAKGGMYGQMSCFSFKTHEAFAWHAFETKKDTADLIEIL